MQTNFVFTFQITLIYISNKCSSDKIFVYAISKLGLIQKPLNKYCVNKKTNKHNFQCSLRYTSLSLCSGIMYCHYNV